MVNKIKYGIIIVVSLVIVVLATAYFHKISIKKQDAETSINNFINCFYSEPLFNKSKRAINLNDIRFMTSNPKIRKALDENYNASAKDFKDIAPTSNNRYLIGYKIVTDTDFNWVGDGKGTVIYYYTVKTIYPNKPNFNKDDWRMSVFVLDSKFKIKEWTDYSLN